MRKLKLIVASLALLVGGTNFASARTDVTSTYLTDAALENEVNNWALVNNGGNHAWDGTYKYHESWHNTFTITQTTAALPAGYYQLSIQAAVEGGNSTTISLQATSGSNSSVVVYPKYSTHSSYADMAAWWAADASHTGNRDLNRIFTTVYVEEGQTLTATFQQTANNQWFVYGQMQLHQLTDAEGRCAQLFEAAYNSRTNQDVASGRYKQRFEDYTAGTVTGKKLTKTISDLPKGYYNVTLNGGASYTSGRGFSGETGDDLTVFYANDASTNVTVVDRTVIGNQEFTDYTASNGFVSDGSLEVGFSNSAIGANWFVGSIKYIEYRGGSLAADAAALPNTGDMAADTWYFLDIVVAGDDYNATATTLGDIICTNDGTQLTSSATGNALTATGNSLSATRYYVKSSTANNLVVEAASYSYDVGTPTLSTAEGGYIQSSSFTVTFQSASTNDPDAEPTLVAESTATVNGNTVDLSAVTKGFSLDLGSLTAGTDYVISIPEGVYGYEGESMNSAISLTIHTPELFDGVYYLYDATNKLFLGRGANYGTCAVADKYGVAMTAATNASGITTFSFIDGSGNLFDADRGNIYTDNSTFPNFAVEATTGGYHVVNKNTTAINSTYDYKLYIDGSGKVVASNENATVWSILTDTERDAIVDAYPTDNINTVITAASISTTAAEFESYLSANYEATNKTSLIGTATFAGAVGDWTWSQVRGQDNQPAYGTNFAELWVATGTYSQTVDKANLPAGIYKVTVDGYERRATNDLSNSLGDAGYNLVSSYLAANDEQVRLTDWYNTSKPGNTGTAVTAFNNGEATNELYIYLDGNTDLTLKLAKPNYVWDCWTIFNNFTLTYFAPVKTVTVTSASFATYVPTCALDFSATDIKAYKVKVSSKGVATLTQVNEVPAGTPVLLYKEGGATEDIPVIASAAEITENDLVAGTGANVATIDGEYTNMILNNYTGTAAFYFANGQIVAANRAYLHIATALAPDAESEAPMVLQFSDEVTGISEVNAAESVSGEIYNLAGQRVAKATKGLYILNGKKVLVK